MPYEKMQAEHQEVDIYEKPMRLNIKGLYADRIIWINRNLPTVKEKTCILAEELGHYYTSSGNILDQKDVRNRKQELKARAWAYNYLIPLQKFVQAHQEGIRNRYELAEYLGVTEQFLDDALNRYKEKFGTHTHYNNYTICFDPLGVLEWFD